MTDQEFLLLFAAMAFLFIVLAKNRQKSGNADGLMNDSDVTVSYVKELLEKFKPNWHDHLKVGYTEKSIEKELKVFFQASIRHVTDQYVIEGAGNKIDFDLGDGSVGVELKLASSVFKSTQQDRMVGQLHTYSEKKYTSDNLIVAVFCTKGQMQERLIKKQVLERLDSIGCEVLFLPTPESTNIE